MKFKSIGNSKNINDYYNHYITVADAKAGVILTIAFVLLDYSFGLDLEKITNKWAIYIPIVFLIGALVAALLTVFPRTPKNNAKGYIFWEEVREHNNKDEYAESFSQLDDNEIEKQFAYQNYLVSNVIHSKHCLVAWSIGLSILAVASIVIIKLAILNA